MGYESVTPNQYSGTDSERIRQAVDAAAASCGTVAIPRRNHHTGGERDVWCIDEAILLPSNITVVLDGCRIKLSDACRDNFFRSANCGLGIADVKPLCNIHLRGQGGAVLEGADHPRATGDSVKKLWTPALGARNAWNLSYGTDAHVADASPSGDWRNIGILLVDVDGFSIEGIHIRHSHCWAISLEYCTRGLLRDIDFLSDGGIMVDGERQIVLNQDGIDLRQGCHDITIENISGHTGDDLIALTAIPHPAARAGLTTSTMISDNRRLDGISRVAIRNVRGYCMGHHIIRLLNTSGMPMHDIIIDGLIDTAPAGVPCRAAIKIGDANPAWGGVTPLGETSRIIISNVVSHAKETVFVEGSLSESLIGNIMKYGAPGEPVACSSGPAFMRNVSISNARTMPS